MATSGLLSPNGAAFMYVAPALRERLERQAVRLAEPPRLGANRQPAPRRAPSSSVKREKYEGGMAALALLYAMEASEG